MNRAAAVAVAAAVGRCRFLLRCGPLVYSCSAATAAAGNHCGRLDVQLLLQRLPHAVAHRQQARAQPRRVCRRGRGET